MFRKNFHSRKLNIMRKRIKKINKNLIEKISKGDILHYCPVDLKEENHDIGVIYDIKEINDYYGDQKNIRRFKIFWQKTQIYDEYSAVTLNYKLNQIYKGHNIMILICNNGNK